MINLVNLLNIVIIISNHENMQKLQPLSFSYGNNSFILKWKINENQKVKADSASLNNTLNTLNTTTQSKALPYIDTP